MSITGRVLFNHSDTNIWTIEQKELQSLLTLIEGDNRMGRSIFVQTGLLVFSMHDIPNHGVINREVEVEIPAATINAQLNSATEEADLIDDDVLLDSLTTRFVGPAK